MDDDHLRDFFAALAMNSLAKEAKDEQKLAKVSYRIADAMLVERNQRKEQSVNDRSD